MIKCVRIFCTLSSQEFDWLMELSPESLIEDPITLNPIGRRPETYYANFEIVHAPSFR